mgnify:CR=1 FL=1
MKRQYVVLTVILIAIILIVILFYAFSSNENSGYKKAESTAVVNGNSSSLDSLTMAWNAYLEADSLSRENNESISDELRDVPKIICDRLLALDADLHGKTDSVSLARSEAYLKLVEDIYNVVGKDSGVEIGKYGRVVRLTHDKYGEVIPAGDAIGVWKVRLSDAYVEEGKSAVGLWQLDGNPKEKTRANSDFKKALELNPQNGEAEALLSKCK